MKLLLAFWLFGCLLFAQGYNFTELRYSDAINRYVQLEGKITFYKDGLDIEYPKTAKELNYKDGVLLYLENNKEVALNELQTSKVTQYFDILTLIHNGNESELKEMFSIKHNSDEDILKPLGIIKHYIKYIILRKAKNSLQYIKLFFQNNDTISITIHDQKS